MDRVQDAAKELGHLGCRNSSARSSRFSTMTSVPFHAFSFDLLADTLALSHQNELPREIQPRAKMLRHFETLENT